MAEHIHNWELPSGSCKVETLKWSVICAGANGGKKSKPQDRSCLFFVRVFSGCECPAFTQSHKGQ